MFLSEKCLCFQALVNFQSYGLTEAIAKMITSLNNRSHLKTEPAEIGKETNNSKK